MFKFHFRMTFNNYSEEAMQQVIAQAIGNPCTDENGDKIGTIVGAESIGKNIIEFEVEVNSYENTY